MILFAIGFVAGIAGYKFFIMYILGKPIHTVCDYCQFRIRKEQLFPTKKKATFQVLGKEQCIQDQVLHHRLAYVAEQVRKWVFAKKNECYLTYNTSLNLVSS